MIKVGVHGAAGRMGAHVIEAVQKDAGVTLAAAIDHHGHPRIGDAVAPGVTLGSDLAPALGACDVWIDFSLPAGSLALLGGAADRKAPVVLATTGFTPEQRAEIEAHSKRTAIVLAANFSLGIHVLLDLVQRAVRSLPDYEIEVLELHHSAKVDAPSGTALRLADTAARARGDQLEQVAVYHREGHTGARPDRAIGLQTLRAGSSPGEHTVFIAGPGERLELTHRALSREGFASGAVRAARWVAGKPAGLYSMDDVLG